MTTKYLNDTGLAYFFNKLKALFATKDIATQSTDGLMSSSDKVKLDGLESYIGHLSGTTVTLGASSGIESIVVGDGSNPVEGINLCDPSQWVSGYLKSNNAFNLNAQDSHHEWTSGYIPVNPGDEITIQVWIDDTTGWGSYTPWIGFYYYNSSKSAAVGEGRYTRTGSSGQTYITRTHTVPAGAAYMRFSWRTYNGSRAQLSISSTELSYYPYKEAIGLVVDNSFIPIDLQGNTIDAGDVLVINGVGGVSIEKSGGAVVFLDSISIPLAANGTTITTQTLPKPSINVGYWTIDSLTIARAFKSINDLMLQ